ncbi:AMP-binding domain-containing protein [Trichostrongylus colubriformis]|uniref:long-chain-fatty-acid--CoA ligase n=1 Tax=Trichostrongylus colubriformis TaxID=6319 RepID=A0AAN8IKA0_TRICO
MVSRRKSDLNHQFPVFDNFSRILPGEERIHENILVEKPITGFPDETVTTVYDVLKRAASITSNGPFLGELRGREYVWKSYETVLHDAQVLGSALLHFGLKPGDSTRVGIAGIHSVRYMTALHALVSYSMVSVPLYHNSKIEALCDIINNCELEVIFCDNEARAESIVKKIGTGEIKGRKKLVLLEPSGTEPNGPHESIPDLEVYSYEHVYEIGKENLKPVVPPTPSSIYIICFTSGTTGNL